MLSNYDLEDIAKKNNIILDGVIYKDDIFKIKKKKNMNIIINLQNSDSDGNGTHWVTLCKRSDKYMYFNSFGVDPPLIIQQYCEKNLGVNKYICQNINTDVCGFYCIAFINYINNTKKVYDVSNEFINLFESDTKKNKAILNKYIKHYMKI